jgi:hypothetical protein
MGTLWQDPCHFIVRHVLRGNLPFFFLFFLLQEKDQRHLEVE